MEMSCQDQETGQKFRSNPARDVARFMPELVYFAGQQLKPERLSADDRQRLKYAGLAVESVESAFAKFMMFFVNSIVVDVKTPFEDMTITGFTAEPQVCQDIVMAAFGRICAGLFAKST